MEVYNDMLDGGCCGRPNLQTDQKKSSALVKLGRRKGRYSLFSSANTHDTTLRNQKLFREKLVTASSTKCIPYSFLQLISFSVAQAFTRLSILLFCQLTNNLFE